MALSVPGLAVVLVAHERRTPMPRPRGSFDARVYALSPANVAFLGLAGNELTPVHAMRVYGDDSSRIEFDAYRAGVPALAYIVEDAVLQDWLWSRLDRQVVAPASCARMAVDGARVSLILDDGRELRAKLVIGADGADSRIREYAGITASAKAYGQSAVVANFACERPHANIAYQWFQGGPVLALLPLPRDHVSMVWSLPSEEAVRIANLEPQALCDELEAATGAVMGAFRLVTPARSYSLRRVAAGRLVSPRVALVGDAAHVIHPLAGQGLNLGLQDVRALSQLLTGPRCVRDAGDLGLLRRYERARAEPILAMDATVDGLYRLFGAQGTIAARLRNTGLNLTDGLPVLKNILIRQALN
jgi:2-polyprenylphenol 6-hydroxylase